MTEQKLRDALHHNVSEPGLDFDERVSRRLMQLTAREETRMRKPAGLIAALALVLLLGIGTAMAAYNENVNELLYQIWPHAAMSLRPVKLNSDSQGIRMEVVSATLNGSESLVTLTMQDLEEDRIDETMDLFDSAILELPYDGAGTCVMTGYHPDTKTASFAVHMDFNIDRPSENDKVTFRVSSFLSHKKDHTIDLTEYMAMADQKPDTMPVPTDRARGWDISTAEGTTENSLTVKETAKTLRVLDTGSSLEIPIVEGVTLTGIGLVDGTLHIQIRYTDILHTDNHGYVTLKDRNGEVYGTGEIQGMGNVSWWGENHDSWDEYIFERCPEDLSMAILTGEFTTAAPAVQGNWHVTFPLSLIQTQEPE